MRQPWSSGCGPGGRESGAAFLKLQCSVSLVAALLSGLLTATEARGQGSEDVLAGQFDFSLPGARSLGMAGAFVALADDATSAYSNPAGLIQLGRPEISFEARGWSFESTAIDRGHAFGPPSGNGLDVIAGTVSETYPSDTAGVSFLSFVYPKRRWAVGLFAHRFPKFETTREIQGAFFDCSGGYAAEVGMPGQQPFCQRRLTEQTGGIDRVQPKEQEIQIGLWSAGATVSVSLTDSFSLGLSGLYYSFSMDSVNRVYSTVDDPFGPKDPERLDIVSIQRGDDHAFALNGGFRWALGWSWVIGGAYRQGPSFDFDHQIEAGPAHADPCEGNVCIPWQTVRFKVPDTFALGVAWRALPTLTLGFQYDLVEFTDLLEQRSQTSGLDGEAARTLEEGLTVDDAHRFRLGVEYLFVFPQGHVLAFRGGVWYDTAHRAYFQGDPETGLPYPQYTLLFPKGEAQVHGTAGMGFTLQPRFQVDAAIDFSDLYKTLSVSAILKF